MTTGAASIEPGAERLRRLDELKVDRPKADGPTTVPKAASLGARL